MGMAKLLQEVKTEVAGSKIVVKVRGKEFEIADEKLAVAILSAFVIKEDIKRLEKTYQEYKSYIVEEAKSYLRDAQTVTFIVPIDDKNKVECKVTFGYEYVIPPEYVEEVKAILGDKFEALVNVKTEYKATKKLVEMACDADNRGELAKYIEIKEKSPVVSFAYE
jgi:hypothetical protein